MKFTRTTLAAGLTLLAAPAFAHITFEAKEVTAGATHKFVLRVPHGCAGSPTTAVRIQIPAELGQVKPQPKADWTLDIARQEAEGDASAQKTDAHAGHDEEIIKEISWSGGKLLDAHYDEFVFRAKVDPAAGGNQLFVPIVQECETGVERWIELPAASGAEPKFPAPSVKVLPGS